MQNKTMIGVHVVSFFVMMRRSYQAIALLLSFSASAQIPFTHADTLRGSVTPARAWWDVLKYDLYVTFNPLDKTLKGFNTIHYKVIQPYGEMQLDLMGPLSLDSVLENGKKLSQRRDGNAYFIQMTPGQNPGGIQKLTAYFHGSPHEAKLPPWDGGTVWAKDRNGRPWITVACQGVGPSIWFPNKDHQYDEPDSATLTMVVPDTLVAVSNGRLIQKTSSTTHLMAYKWGVSNPINNYNLIPYIGKYVNLHETLAAEKGKLDVDYWVIDYRVEDAKRHMQPDVRKTIKNLEYWFGPYPFYEDGFKMVETPHLGMEHQSAIAYGNNYVNGYRGKDLSGSGWGLKWDFIIVHEAAHEWFGNNISTKDLADMWVHEGFANYAETLFTESEFGKEAGSDYLVGTRNGIKNDKPIIPAYNVNQEGSGDMYPKGGNMIHNIRQIMRDDEKFRQMLRGLNRDFYHQTVTTQQIEDYISRAAGRNLSKVFDQYLRTKDVPVFTFFVERRKKNSTIRYKWENCVDGFDMPVKIRVNGEEFWLDPTREYKTIKVNGLVTGSIVDRNFYVIESRTGS
jgi:aminopeptidase N